MSRFRRERLAERYGLKPRDMEFLNALVEFTREWRVVGSGADARVVSNEVFVGQARLAKMMGCSPNTVAAAAKACTAAGLVVWLGRGKARMTAATGEWTNSTNRYTVTLLASEVCADAPAAVAAVAGDNALALVRETGEKVPAEVSAAAAVAAPAEREGSAVQGRGMRLGRAADAMECSDTSKGSSSSSRGGAAEEEEVPLCLSDGRTVTSAKRGANGNYGGFLSDGGRYGCDAATMDALRAGAAVEARRQQGGYQWLVAAPEARAREASSRVSDDGRYRLLHPAECTLSEVDESGWLSFLAADGSTVAEAFVEACAKLVEEFRGGGQIVARREDDGSWQPIRRASLRERERGKPVTDEERNRGSIAS